MARGERFGPVGVMRGFQDRLDFMVIINLFIVFVGSIEPSRDAKVKPIYKEK